MPFRSEKQRRYLFSKHPELAKRWAQEYPESNKGLPMYAHNNKNQHSDDSVSKEQGIKQGILGIIKASRYMGKFPNDIFVARVKQRNSPVNTKVSNSILNYVAVPHSSQPVSAGEEQVMSAGAVLGNKDNDKSLSVSNKNQDPVERLFGISSKCSSASANPANAEIAPILKELGLAWQKASAVMKPGKNVQAMIQANMAAKDKAQNVARGILGSARGLDRGTAQISAPDPYRFSSQQKTDGLNLPALSRGVNTLKLQRQMAQNPLPLGHPSGNGQQTPNNTPVASYPGMASSPPPANTRLNSNVAAGRSARTDPIGKQGPLTMENGKPSFTQNLTGNNALGGAGNMHGLEGGISSFGIKRMS
jgi:hypothetical protein